MAPDKPEDAGPARPIPPRRAYLPASDASIVALLKQQPLEYRAASARIEGEAVVMAGPTGVHTISLLDSSEDRIAAHWAGFCRLTDQFLLKERLTRCAEGLAIKRGEAPATHQGFWQDRIDQVQAWLEAMNRPLAGALRQSSIRALSEFERLAGMGASQLETAPAKSAAMPESDPQIWRSGIDAREAGCLAISEAEVERRKRLAPEAKAYLDDLLFIGLDECAFHEVFSNLLADSAIDDAGVAAIARAYAGETGAWPTREEALGAIETNFYEQRSRAAQEAQNRQGQTGGRGGQPVTEEGEEQEAAGERLEAPATPRPDRVYLLVPFAEKDDAKALGAKWDGEAKSWYAPSDIDLAGVSRWLPSTAIHNDPVAEFAEALGEAGLILSGPPVMNGRLHRVRVEGDAGGRKSGAYIGHLDGHPAGYIQNFKTGLRARWKSAMPAGAADHPYRAAAAEERQRQREAERRAIHEETVRLVAAHLALLSPATSDHPYLARKGVGAHGLILNHIGPLDIVAGEEVLQKWGAKGCLLAPIRDIDGQLLGAQSIDTQGRKAFPRGARIAGGCHRIGALDGPETRMIVITEGYATAATLHEATGLTVAIAFNAANLEAVARAYRMAFPDRPIIIAGDNDHQLALTIGADGRLKPNVGRLAAEQAAAAVGGHALIPAFAFDDLGSDWNDLAASNGRQELLAQWNAGMETAMGQFETSRPQGRTSGRSGGR